MQDSINELTDHGVLTGTDQVEVFTLDLVHHGIHLGETHYAGNHFRANHEGGDAVGEAAVDHEITGIGDHSGVKAGNVTHEIVEAVACNLACGIQV